MRSRKIILGEYGSCASHAGWVLPALANESFHKLVVCYAKASALKTEVQYGVQSKTLKDATNRRSLASETISEYSAFETKENCQT